MHIFENYGGDLKMMQENISIFDFLPPEDAAKYLPKKSDDWK